MTQVLSGLPVVRVVAAGAAEVVPVRVRFTELLLEKERLEGRSYTQEEVAEAIGVTRQTLVPWRDGTIEFLRLETLSKICAFFGCTPGDVLVLDSGPG